MNGVQLIEAERKNHLARGYDAAHDDAHGDHELASAAACYAVPAPIYTIEFCGDGDTHDVWPWNDYAGDVGVNVGSSRQCLPLS